MGMREDWEYLKVGGGLRGEGVGMEGKEIDEVNKEFRDFDIFKGVEMEMLAEGRVDYEEEVVGEMDVVIGWMD